MGLRGVAVVYTSHNLKGFADHSLSNLTALSDAAGEVASRISTLAGAAGVQWPPD